MSDNELDDYYAGPSGDPVGEGISTFFKIGGAAVALIVAGAIIFSVVFS